MLECSNGVDRAELRCMTRCLQIQFNSIIFLTARHFNNRNSQIKINFRKSSEKVGERKMHESSQPFNMFILLNGRHIVYRRLFIYIYFSNDEVKRRKLLSNSFWNGFECIEHKIYSTLANPTY